MWMFAVGVEFHAQISTENTFGAETGGLRQFTDNRPRAGGLQDVHLPGVDIHGRHRLSEPIGKCYLAIRK